MGRTYLHVTSGFRTSTGNKTFHWWSLLSCLPPELPWVLDLYNIRWSTSRTQPKTVRSLQFEELRRQPIMHCAHFQYYEDGATDHLRVLTDELLHFCVCIAGGRNLIMHQLLSIYSPLLPAQTARFSWLSPAQRFCANWVFDQVVKLDWLDLMALQWSVVADRFGKMGPQILLWTWMIPRYAFSCPVGSNSLFQPLTLHTWTVERQVMAEPTCHLRKMQYCATFNAVVDKSDIILTGTLGRNTFKRFLVVVKPAELMENHDVFYPIDDLSQMPKRKFFLQVSFLVLKRSKYLAWHSLVF